MPVVIAPERPDSPDAVRLIDELESILDPLYPKTSRHGLSVEKLIVERVHFFVIRSDGEAAGCGGVKFYGGEYAEVKRMYVRPSFRGIGLARLMLDHLAETTRHLGVTLLRLETGIHQREAIGLYESWGFRRIAPFGEYKEDPLSLFFEKQLSS